MDQKDKNENVILFSVGEVEINALFVKKCFLYGCVIGIIIGVAYFIS